MKTLSIFLLPLFFAQAAAAFDALDNQPLSPNLQTFQPGISGKDSTNTFVKDSPQAPSDSQPSAAPAQAPAPAPTAQKAAATPAPAPLSAPAASPSSAPSVPTVDTTSIPVMQTGSQPSFQPIHQVPAQEDAVDPYFGHAPAPVPTYQTPAPKKPAAVPPPIVTVDRFPLPTPKPEVSTPDTSGPFEPITLYAAGNYRLRKGPWKRPIFTIIPKGAAFHVLRKEGQWYVVEYNGKQGYVFEQGITHPLAKAIQEQEGMQDLTEDEAAEVAACVTEHSIPNLPFEMQKFVKNVQAQLQPYVEQQKTVDAVASKKRYSRKRKPLAMPAPVVADDGTPMPPPRPHLVSSKHPASSGTHAAPVEQANSGVSGSSTDAPAEPNQPNQNPARAKKIRQQLSDKNARLAKACWQAASRPRALARFRCKALGHGYPCGTVSGVRTPKYMCLKGVMECLKDALNINLPIKDDSFASKKRAMQAVGTKIGVNSCREAPVGSVCIYTASYHDYGHIEVKIMRQDPTTGVSRIYYCSDFCSDHPVDEYTNGKHKANHTFQGAYGL